MDLKCRRVWFQVLNELPRFLPFLLSVCIYFVLAPQSSCPLWIKALLKCLPNLFLCTYIWAPGINMYTQAKARKLLAGLLFSAAGDIFRTLSTQLYHLHSVSMFGLAYVCYIWMFGLKPVNLLAGLYLAIIGAVYLLFLTRCLWDQNSFQWAAFIYIGAGGTMAWRACAGILFIQSWSWLKLSAAIGGLLLVVSDFTYTVSAWCFPVSNSTMIAATYYTGQMLIALSAVNPQKLVGRNKR
ncbi:lysoplasmalogenase TMEM86A-like [Narcine bancroftii]|uniref:lysoplasmalogenase TMEM86A-like n=1 Tax=Narcine bancroftii TaxID=1343680 RepID=UPI003831C16C